MKIFGNVICLTLICFLESAIEVLQFAPWHQMVQQRNPAKFTLAMLSLESMVNNPNPSPLNFKARQFELLHILQTKFHPKGGGILSCHHLFVDYTTTQHGADSKDHAATVALPRADCARTGRIRREEL